MRERVRGLCIGLLVLGVVVALSGCGEKGLCEQRGYSPIGGDSYCKLLELGDGGETARPGDYVTVMLRYYTWGDSLFFDGGRRFQLEKSNYAGSIDDCFSRLSAGDSASFYINAQSFFERTLGTTRPRFLDSAHPMRVDVRMVDIEDSASFAHDKEAFLHWIEDFSEYERVILRQYLLKERISTHAIDSLYYLPITAGTGAYPKNGDTLTIEFEGRFLDGKFFDSTKKRHEPFVFVLGQKWQVIEGLERAVRLMREGEHAVFILPSSIAFGESGSSTGIVPPYTPVVFEVEFTELKPGERDADS